MSDESELIDITPPKLGKVKPPLSSEVSTVAQGTATPKQAQKAYRALLRTEEDNLSRGQKHNFIERSKW